MWIPSKSQSYQSSISCWTIIGPPAKRHFNGVSLACPWWPAYRGLWILPPLIQLKKSWTPSGKTFYIRAWKSYDKMTTTFVHHLYVPTGGNITEPYNHRYYLPLYFTQGCLSFTVARSIKQHWGQYLWINHFPPILTTFQRQEMTRTDHHGTKYPVGL